MAKLVILTLELQEARALLERVKQPNDNELNQYRGQTQVAVNKLEKAVKRASLKDPELQ